MTAVAEMRIYKTKPGRREDWIQLFREKSIPEHKRIGMKIVGPFLSAEDDDSFFWIRVFPDRDSRDGMKSEFYDGELWHKELEHALLPNLESYHSVLIEAPPELLGA